jgi:hypothetical protein
MMKAWTITEEMELMFDEMVNAPVIEAEMEEEERENERIRKNREWLANPANHDSEIYSDIYKDVYGVRPH